MKQKFRTMMVNSVTAEHLSIPKEPLLDYVLFYLTFWELYFILMLYLPPNINSSFSFKAYYIFTYIFN